MNRTRTCQGFSLGITGLAALLAFSACSTIQPVETGRLGLIDSLAAVDSTYRITSTGRLTPERVRFIRQSVSDWRWPLSRVHITSHYGERGKAFHEGVDLRARIGTPVFAVQSGEVVYSGSGISGYGRMVVIKHDSGLTSLYAHNSKLLVKRGARVKQGEKIALSGRSGRTSGPHVHFEVRDGVIPIDPSQVLPNSGPGWQLASASDR